MTIRQDAEAIRAETDSMLVGRTERIKEHAQAILDALDAAEHDVFETEVGYVALIPDPIRHRWPFHPGNPPTPWTDSDE